MRTTNVDVSIEARQHKKANKTSKIKRMRGEEKKTIESRK